MPRGGRRPGAGAPRGNLNALTSGKHCRRMAESLAALQLLRACGDEPALRRVLVAVRDAGYLYPRGRILANMPAVIRLIHPMLIDCVRDLINQHNQSRTRFRALPRLAPPPAEPAPARRAPRGKNSRKNK